MIDLSIFTFFYIKIYFDEKFDKTRPMGLDPTSHLLVPLLSKEKPDSIYFLSLYSLSLLCINSSPITCSPNLSTLHP